MYHINYIIGEFYTMYHTNYISFIHCITQTTLVLYNVPHKLHYWRVLYNVPHKLHYWRVLYNVPHKLHYWRVLYNVPHKLHYWRVYTMYHTNYIIGEFYTM